MVINNHNDFTNAVHWDFNSNMRMEPYIPYTYKPYEE